MSKSIWTRESGQSMPDDLLSGRYEFCFHVGSAVAAIAINQFWANKADTLDIDCGNGQHFLPAAIYPDNNGDLVILADVQGFWPQLLGVALAAIGIGIVVAVSVREFRLLSEENKPFVISIGLTLLVVAVIVLIFFLRKK